MQSTGIVSDHTIDGTTHCFTIQHGMGDSWSMFIKIMLGPVDGIVLFPKSS